MTAPTQLDLSHIYSTAADLIERDGWAFQDSVTPDGGRCATTAVNHAAGREMSDRAPDLFEPFAAWLKSNRPDQVLSFAGGDCDCSGCMAVWDGIYFVQRWNDEPGRTIEQVVSALREFAASTLAERAPGADLS